MKRWTILLLVLAMTAAACGGADTSDTTAAAGGVPDTTGGEAVGIDACAPGQTDGDLNFYNWAEYIDPDLITAFEAEAGIDVEYTEYDSNEQMLAQVEAGAAPYDLVVPSDYMVDTMLAEDLLVKLNKSALSNLGNLDPAFVNLPFDPNSDYSVPYQWGTTGIGINTATLGDVDPSWDLIFDADVADQYQGRISMLDDPLEAMVAALHYLGYTLEEVIADNNLDAIAEAEAVLTEANARVAKYDSVNYGDDLVNGEIDIAHGWSGGFFFSFAEVDNPDDYAYIIPKEGGVRWVDNLAIPVTVEHPCSALAMIDFLLDAENGAQLTNWNYYGSPNKASEEFILPEILDDPAIYPTGDALEGLEFIPQTGELGLELQDAFLRSKG